MSKKEQKTTDTEPKAPAAQADGALSSKSASKSDGKSNASSPASAKARPAKTGRGIALLSLLVAVAALALSAYIGWRGMPLEQSQPGLVTGQEQLQAQIARQQARLTETIQTLPSLRGQVSEQQQRSDRLLNRVDSLSRKLSDLAGTNREGWKLAEVEYLLRLANQRLLMSADVTGAKALLANADAILLELDDYTLYPVREALAEDMAVLRAVPDYDQEGLYLRLQALIGQVDELPLLQQDQALVIDTAEQNSSQTDPEIASEAETEGWKTVALGMLQQAWESFAGLFRFTADREQPVAALLTPEEDILIRQNLRLLLEQGKLAVLAREQAVYSNSMQQAGDWIERYFFLSGEASAAMVEELQTLSELTVRPDLPNISRALDALKQSPTPAEPAPPVQPEESVSETANNGGEQQI